VNAEAEKLAIENARLRTALGRAKGYIKAFGQANQQKRDVMEKIKVALQKNA
jgi:hypothetical protein